MPTPNGLPRGNRVGVILSGGPASVHEAVSPLAPGVVFELGVPVLGICYGEQLLCHQLGGAVETSDHREFGRAYVEVTDDCALFLMARGRLAGASRCG